MAKSRKKRSKTKKPRCAAFDCNNKARKNSSWCSYKCRGAEADMAGISPHHFEAGIPCTQLK